MIEELNNDYDLESIEVRGPFAIGDTKPGRGGYREDWRVRWRDETTLMIAPNHAPDEWRPADIYSRSRPRDIETWGDFWAFNLTPNRDQRSIMEAAGLIDRAHERVLDICAKHDDDAVWEGPLGEAGKSLALACTSLETALGFKIPRPVEEEASPTKRRPPEMERDPRSALRRRPRE